MAAELFLATPTRALDASGNTLSGARWFFYLTGTTTPQAVYTTSALSVAHSNPVTADSGGKFAAIYLDKTKTYRGILKDASGTTIYDIDPINSSADTTIVTTTGSQSISGKTFTGGTVFTNVNSGTTGAIVINDAVGDPGGGYIQATNNARSVQYGYLRFVNGSTYVNSNFHTAGDNSNSLGLNTNRWSVVYAATGAINTSDERDKTWRGAATEAEVRAGLRIVGELGFYQWSEEVAKKGDDARFHFGPRAQRIWAIMAEEGLVDPISDGKPGKTPYAFLCFDEWDAKAAIPATPGEQDGDGNWLSPPTPGEPAREAGWRYGIREGQLALFLVACVASKL